MDGKPATVDVSLQKGAKGATKNGNRQELQFENGKSGIVKTLPVASPNWATDSARDAAVRLGFGTNSAAPAFAPSHAGAPAWALRGRAVGA